MSACKNGKLKGLAMRTTSGFAIIACALVSSHAAFAQTTAPAAAGANSVEAVVVTGSHIVRDGYEAPTPVTVLGKDTLDAMGKINIADAVNQLPQLMSSITPAQQPTGISGGTLGVNELNLRDLGTNRTLVLQDGKRIVNSSISANFVAPDVNTVPNALVSRVDIATGGASAVYGSDALGGVVNFVIDHNFTGIKGSLEGGETTYGDNGQYEASLTAGTAFGSGSRGHIEVSAEIAHNDGVPHTNRPWNAIPTSVITNPNFTSTNGQPFYLVALRVGLSTGTPGGPGRRRWASRRRWR